MTFYRWSQSVKMIKDLKYMPFPSPFVPQLQAAGLNLLLRDHKPDIKRQLHMLHMKNIE